MKNNIRLISPVEVNEKFIKINFAEFVEKNKDIEYFEQVDVLIDFLDKNIKNKFIIVNEMFENFYIIKNKKGVINK